MKPGSLSLPFLAGAKEMLAGAQMGLGMAGTALLSTGWSQSDQAALTDATVRGWNTKHLPPHCPGGWGVQDQGAG